MHDESDFEWLTADQFKYGDYSGWLRVEIYQVGLREGRNGEYLHVIYHPLCYDYPKKWKLSQNYFGLGEDDNRMTNSLGEITGLNQLHHHNIHKLVGKQLEIRLALVYRQDRDFIDVVNHRKLTKEAILKVG